MECRFDDAVLAARDVRGIGPEDSEEFLISLLLEGAAVKGQGGDPTSQFEEFASRSASVTSVLEAEELAMQSFGPFVDRCRN